MKRKDILDAITNDDIEAVEEILSSGQDAVYKRLGGSDIERNAMLAMFCTEVDKVRPLRYLIEHGYCRPDTVDGDNVTLFSSAAMYGSLAVVKYLYENYCIDINCQDDDNKDTPLTISAFRGHLAVVQYLVSLPKIDLKAVDAGGHNAFMRAASRFHIDVLKFLITVDGIDIDTRDCRQNNLANVVASSKSINDDSSELRLETMKYLCSINAIDITQVNNKKHNALLTAIYYERFKLVKYLIEEVGGIDINAVDSDGNAALNLAVYNDDYEMVTYFTQRQGVNINNKNVFCYTPLGIAIYKSNLKIVKYLASLEGVDFTVTNRYGDGLLATAAYRGNLSIVEFVLNLNKMNIDKVNNIGSTAFHMAAFHGHLDVLKCLVGHGADIHVINFNGDNAFTLAALSRSLKCLQYIASLPGIDINFANNFGNTALTLSCTTNIDIVPQDLNVCEHKDATQYLENVKFLCGLKGINLNHRNNNGDSAFLLASNEKDPNIAEYLLTVDGIDIGNVNNRGNNALMVGILHKHVNFVKALVKLEIIDINHQNKQHNTALLLSAAAGSWEIMKCLMAVKGINLNCTNVKGDTVFIIAAANGNLEIVQELAKIPEIDKKHEGENGCSAIASAAIYGKIDVVEYLLNAHFATIRYTNAVGNSLLIIAATHGHLDLVRYLVKEQGADVEDVNSLGDDALMVAAANGHLRIVKYLASLPNADLENTNDAGYTPLLFAASNGHIKIVKYLIEQQNVNAKHVDQQSLNALMLAIAHGNFDIVQYFVEELESGLDCKTVNHDSPFMVAAMHGNLDIMKYLAKHDTRSVNYTNKNGETALSLAAEAGHWHIVKHLVEELHARPNTRNTDGENALMKACRNGEERVARYLVDQCKVDVNVKNTKYGNTALMYAAANGYVELAKYLCALFAIKLEATNNEGYTALSLAISRGQIEIAQCLVLYGANTSHLTHDKSNLLLLAVSNNNVNALRYVCTLPGVDCNYENSHGYTALTLAASKGYVNIVKCLVEEMHVDIARANKRNETPLLLSVKHNHLDVAQYFRNYITSKIVHSIERQIYDVVEKNDHMTLLGMLRANPNLKLSEYTHNNQTILTMALTRNYVSCARVLCDYDLDILQYGIKKALENKAFDLLSLTLLSMREYLNYISLDLKKSIERVFLDAKKPIDHFIAMFVNIVSVCEDNDYDREILFKKLLENEIKKYQKSDSVPWLLDLMAHLHDFMRHVDANLIFGTVSIYLKFTKKPEELRDFLSIVDINVLQLAKILEIAVENIIPFIKHIGIENIPELNNLDVLRKIIGCTYDINFARSIIEEKRGSLYSQGFISADSINSLLDHIMKHWGDDAYVQDLLSDFIGYADNNALQKIELSKISQKYQIDFMQCVISYNKMHCFAQQLNNAVVLNLLLTCKFDVTNILKTYQESVKAMELHKYIAVENINVILSALYDLNKSSIVVMDMLQKSFVSAFHGSICKFVSEKKPMYFLQLDFMKIICSDDAYMNILDVVLRDVASDNGVVELDCWFNFACNNAHYQIMTTIAKYMVSHNCAQNLLYIALRANMQKSCIEDLVYNVHLPVHSSIVKKYEKKQDIYKVLLGSKKNVIYTSDVLPCKNLEDKLDIYKYSHIIIKPYECETEDHYAYRLKNINSMQLKGGWIDEYKNTPLFYAAKCGFFTVTMELLAKNIEFIDMQNNEKMTPAHIACINSHADILEYLISSGADLSIQDQYGRTVEDIAIDQQDINIMKLIYYYDIINSEK